MSPPTGAQSIKARKAMIRAMPRREFQHQYGRARSPRPMKYTQALKPINATEALEAKIRLATEYA